MFQQENENGFYCSIFVYALQIIKLTIILAAIFLPTWSLQIMRIIQDKRAKQNKGKSFG